MCNVAIIGAGSMALEHIRAFSALEGVRVVGIHSRTKSKADELSHRFGIGCVAGSVNELMEVCKPDIVVVAVNELSTEEICAQAFEYPAVFLIEKPVGYNYTVAQRIALMAEKKRVKAFVALNRRHYSSTRSALGALENDLGVRVVTVIDQEDLIAVAKLNKPEEVLRNWMYANSIHLLDYFTLFCRGDLQSVSVHHPWDESSPFYVAATLEYDSGDRGLYQAYWNAPAPWFVSVNTRSQRWEMRPVEQATRQVYGSRALEPIEKSQYDTDYKPGFYVQAQQVVAAWENRPHSLPAIQEALKSMFLVKEIYRKSN